MIAIKHFGQIWGAVFSASQEESDQMANSVCCLAWVYLLWGQGMIDWMVCAIKKEFARCHIGSHQSSENELPPDLL